MKIEKRRKIGILTFQDTVNYGAMLQTYALQRYINNKGIDCEVINYKNEFLEEKERPIKLLKQKTLKGILKFFKCHKYQVRKWKKFSEFKEKNIKVSNRVYTKENINEIENEYEKIIVGSDQVWNTQLTGEDFTYYLEFIKDNKKKNSYAASFGFSEWPDRIKEKAIEKIATFNTLNVREEQAKNLIVNEIDRKDINVVVDPTFLLEKAEWEKFVNKEEKEYIAVYMIDFRKDVFEFIKKLAKDNNCEIVYIHDAILSQKGMINSRDDSVEKFLSLIHNAKYVVTGSFHALCMSLIYEKQFYYTLNSKNNRNSRILNLINLVHQEDRVILDGKCNTTNTINYKEINEKIRIKVEESKRVLQVILGE